MRADAATSIAIEPDPAIAGGVVVTWCPRNAELYVSESVDLPLSNWFQVGVGTEGFYRWNSAGKQAFFRVVERR